MFVRKFAFSLVVFLFNCGNFTSSDHPFSRLKLSAINKVPTTELKKDLEEVIVLNVFH